MTANIIKAIDKEIAELQSAKAILLGIPSSTATGKKRGRPAGSTNKSSALTVLKSKRVLSPEGKAKIAAAQKKRWAAAKKAA